VKYPSILNFPPGAWSGTKRRWVPGSLWKRAMGSSLMGLPVVHLVIRWVFNKTDPQFRRWR
jgi:hypothetical protein